MPDFEKGHGTGSILALRPGQERARKVITRSGGIVRGKFPSRKNGRMVHYEALLEHDAFCLFEASPAIAGYREQPCSILYPDGPELRKYTPDVELTLVSGEQVLVEIKPALTAKRPDMAHKLACIGDFFDRNGKSFVVLTDDVIRQQPRLKNIIWIHQMAKKIRIDPSQVNSAMTAFRQHLPISVKEAAELLEPTGCDPCSLLLIGALFLNLDEPVSPSTVLYLAEESEHAWFQLAGRFGF